MKWTISENRIPSRAEVERLIDAMRRRAEDTDASGARQPVVDWAVVHCLIGSGVRSHEIADLQVGDLRLGNGESSILIRHGKGDKARVVAISVKLKEHLQEFLHWKQARGESVRLDAPLFRSERGGRFCTRAIRHLFKRCLRHAGLDSRFGVHSMRHFHLSTLYARTNDLRLVQDQAGHSSVAITQVYTHVSLDKRRAAVDAAF